MTITRPGQASFAISGGGRAPVRGVRAARSQRAGRQHPASADLLPATGFAPGSVTALPPQPGALAYTALGKVWLEIPALGIRANITGVLRHEDQPWLTLITCQGYDAASKTYRWRSVARTVLVKTAAEK